MKNFVSAGTFLLVILLAVSVFASGVSLTGIGARATALCGAYRGISSDWSAMYWNPAGLTQTQGLQGGLSFERIKPTAFFTPSQWAYREPPAGFIGDTTTVVTDFSNMNKDETKNQDRTFYIPALGVTYGMEKLAIGFGLYVPFGLGAEWDLLNTGIYNDKYPEIDYEDDLKIIDFHPTIAYKLNDKLSVGIGLSIVYADIIIRTPKYIPNPYLTTKELVGFRKAYLDAVGAGNPEFNHLLIDSELEGTGWGFGGNIGLLFNMTEDFKIGLSARYYADVAIDGKLNATAYFADLAAANELIQGNELLLNTLQGKVASGEMTETEYGVVANYYSGGTSVTYDNTSGETDLPLPLEVGIGFSYTGINNLLIAADFSWVNWSVWDVIEIDIVEAGEKSNLLENWDDGMRFSLGLEYKLDLLTLRGGYYYEGGVVPEETLTPTIPDINSRNAISLGFQYDLGPVALHLSYERILIGDKTVKDWIYNPLEKSYDNLSGNYRMNVSNFMTGLEYHF